MSSNERLVKASVVVFDLPFMLNLPDDQYAVYFDEDLTTVHLKRINSPVNMPGLPTGVQFAPNSVILGDRWGKFNYTRVRVVFHHLFFILPSPLFPNYLLSKAIDIMNRLFSVCRGVKGDHYIRITRNDIFSYNVFYFDPSDKQKKESVSVPFGSNIMSTSGASEPTNEQLTRIREILSTNAHLPLFQELIFDAWDYHFYGNYRAAVIEVGTAFEIFIDNLIWSKYLQSGMSEVKIQKILETGLMNLLRDHIKKITGHDFYSSQEFTNWERDAYQIRNETVHKGKKISENESSKAITTVSNTIRYILPLT
ncbi:MAG TPA: hypothetical protein VD694_02795 [Nitrososphaeraceae archaeon]|nr:hypothetical protein [Nitrososphaeraceae archaeon]